MPLGQKISGSEVIEKLRFGSRFLWPIWWLNEQEIDHYSRELGYGILTPKEKEEVVRQFKNYVENLLRSGDYKWGDALRDFIRDLKEIPAGEKGKRIYIQREKGG